MEYEYMDTNMFVFINKSQQKLDIMVQEINNGFCNFTREIVTS